MVDSYLSSESLALTLEVLERNPSVDHRRLEIAATTADVSPKYSFWASLSNGHESGAEIATGLSSPWCQLPAHKTLWLTCLRVAGNDGMTARMVLVSRVITEVFAVQLIRYGTTQGGIVFL